MNQYTSRTVPDAVDIIGVATNTATVTVNNYPTTRKGSYYRAELPIANISGPVYQPVTNLAVLNRGTNADLIATNVGKVLVPPATQTFAYDQDGNTTNDSLWSYVWDGENRLVQMTSDPAVPAAAQKQLNFTYDDQCRRIQKIVSTWDSGTSTFIAQSTNLFIYDGCNLVGELNGANDSVIYVYMWGLDVSGWPQDAGGVGGLLKETYVGSSLTNCFAAYDGNGNVMSLVDAVTGNIDAQFEYGAFGELLRCISPLAKIFPFRFSTKYQDAESGLLYFGHRYCNPSTGCWLNKDPLEETGGNNLYSFALNDPVMESDIDGRITLDTHGVLHYGCYGYSAYHYIAPERVHSDSGYIIQKVTIIETINSCGGSYTHYHYSFWEIAAWTHANVLDPIPRLDHEGAIYEGVGS